MVARENQSDEANDTDRFTDVRTHANFYLAQVYGSLNMADESARYCLSTLELQLLTLLSEDGAESESSIQIDGIGDVEGVREWVKNCLRLVDFYLGTENLKDASTCLFACEHLMKNAHRHEDEKSGEDDEQEKVRVQRAEIYLSWAKLHHLALKMAQFRDEGYRASSPSGVSTTSLESTLLTFCKENATMTSLSLLEMEYVPADTITSFDVARKVFKLGMSACEHAKQVFVLNGFVTQHVRLLQLESVFYKRLLHFETDLKRQIAMQLRRLGLLTPLLAEQLNPDAYCALLQELNYECAEIAAEIYDLKQVKKSVSDDKTNAFALKAIHFYQQYLLLFYPVPQNGDQSAAARTLPSGKGVRLPPASMTPNEFRSVLLGYFGLARVCGRLHFPTDKEKTVVFWKQSLEYHHSVLELVTKYEHAKQSAPAGENGDALHHLFDAELNICREMAELLPEKINQLVYNGKVL